MKDTLKVCRVDVRVPFELNRAIEILAECQESNKSKLVRQWIHEGMQRELRKMNRNRAA